MSTHEIRKACDRLDKDILDLVIEAANARQALARELLEDHASSKREYADEVLNDMLDKLREIAVGGGDGE